MAPSESPTALNVSMDIVNKVEALACGSANLAAALECTHAATTATGECDDYIGGTLFIMAELRGIEPLISWLTAIKTAGHKEYLR